MQVKAIFKIVGMLLMMFSLSMLPPVAVSLFYGDGAFATFIISFLITLGVGTACWLPFRNSKQELKIRDGFVVVVLFWTVLSVFAAIPLILSVSPTITITDGIFESVSGFTATGSSVLIHIDNLPHAILYYRQQLQLLGGMGIVVLAVAVLPMLGVGGMQLYRAETPGPVKDNKLTPRLTETAKSLWYIYIGLIAVCALCYWWAGMSLFDAIGESFSTIATGGFSTHDSSFAYYDSLTIDIVASVFMFLGGVNFGLHYLFLSRANLKLYWADLEFRSYVFILVVVATITAVMLLLYHDYDSVSEGVVSAIFTVISLTTTTGLVTDNFATWPTFVPVMLVMVGMIGGCAASTSGGLKIIRVVLLQKQGRREMRRLVHPRAVLPLKYGNQVLSENIVQAIWGFVAMFVVIYVVLLLALLALGLDFKTAFGALSAALSNVGAAIGGVSSGFHALGAPSKWILIVAMLAGRLEVFTLLVLFTPSFWRH